VARRFFKAVDLMKAHTSGPILDPPGVLPWMANENMPTPPATSTPARASAQSATSSTTHPFVLPPVARVPSAPASPARSEPADAEDEERVAGTPDEADNVIDLIGREDDVFDFSSDDDFAEIAKVINKSQSSTLPATQALPCTQATQPLARASFGAAVPPVRKSQSSAVRATQATPSTSVSVAADSRAGSSSSGKRKKPLKREKETASAHSAIKRAKPPVDVSASGSLVIYGQDSDSEVEVIESRPSSAKSGLSVTPSLTAGVPVLQP
ncbi:hypothetical protein PFISCL1PPCAC_4028, partial [Pristionchus fissidentatus]